MDVSNRIKRLAVDSRPVAITDLAGIWTDDATVLELVEEIYRLRDDDQQRIAEELDGRV
jgi:hypothetical protein